ncbi:MAG: hypothetical protein HYS86_04390 [Candidatus Chisholmbacteria bacterium]|nr:hypothetical protein [Candidatus Chisholmbacteria bacterium]
MRILITAAGGELARPTAKSLKRGNPRAFLVGIDVDPTYLPLATVDKRYTVPRASSRDYFEAIERICRENRIDLIVPQTDVEIYLLGKRRDHLPAKLWLPRQEVIEKCRDKFTCQQQLAFTCQQQLAENKVPVPETRLAQPFGEVREMLSKHQHVWLRASIGSGGIGAKLVVTVKEAQNWLEKFGPETQFTVAEYLPGAIFAWNSVWRKGKLVLYQAVERLRYHLTSDSATSLGVGTSVIRTTGRKEVGRIGRAAVAALDPEPDGIYAVDMTENKRGTPCVTEINAGRFVTTSTMLLEKANCFFPWYAIQIFRGKPITLKKRFNPIKPNLYLVGGRIADPVLVTEKEVKIPSWQSISKE